MKESGRECPMCDSMMNIIDTDKQTGKASLLCSDWPSCDCSAEISDALLWSREDLIETFPPGTYFVYIQSEPIPDSEDTMIYVRQDIDGCVYTLGTAVLRSQHLNLCLSVDLAKGQFVLESDGKLVQLGPLLTFLEDN